MKVDTARKAAFDDLNSIFLGNPTVGRESLAAQPADYGLYLEILQGSLREWGFLNWVLKHFLKKAPSKKLNQLLVLSAYQLLFLDKVPAYAVFSEAKKIAISFKASVPEQKFLHGTLKSVEREKKRFLEAREDAMDKIKTGVVPNSDLEWATLNASPELVEILTIDTSQSIAVRSMPKMRAIQTLFAMRAKPELIGYRLPLKDVKEPAKNAPGAPKTFYSMVAPYALAMKPQHLKEESLVVQGEASQWVCQWASEWIIQKSLEENNVHVLEMCAGKGGKLLGTLSALVKQEHSPHIEWVAADASSAQLRLLRESTFPKARKVYPTAKLHMVHTDFKKSLPDEFKKKEFELIWLDAPCSGFGTLSKLPEIAVVRGQNPYVEAKKLAQVQRDLLNSALKLLKPGAGLFYTVCTMTREETLDQKKYLEDKGLRCLKSAFLYPGFDPAPRAEGFFGALFLRERF